MESVSFKPLVVQSGSSRDWTPTRRAKAASNVRAFTLEYQTDPSLPNLAAGLVQMAYPLHHDPTTVRAILWLAAERGWNRDATREAVKAILATRFMRRCRGFDNRCRVHNPIVVHDRTTGSVAAFDAKGVVHVTD